MPLQHASAVGTVVPSAFGHGRQGRQVYSRQESEQKLAAHFRHHLIIVCGVPGAGKSTLAWYVVERFKAIVHASENFASQLGSAARNDAGDLTPPAIAHAYTQMAIAVNSSLSAYPLVLAVGSFRSQDQRRQFREIGAHLGARVSTVRVACAAEIAASRVLARRAEGENGPDQEAIHRISSELDRADDIDIIISNEASIAVLQKRADVIISEALSWCEISHT